MNMLKAELIFLEKVMPGFIAKVEKIPFECREKESNGLLAIYKECGGVDLAIPVEYGGKGLNTNNMVMLQSALGYLSPSLAIAITMHQFSVATLVEMTKSTDGIEWMVLQAIAENKLYLASAFSEGSAGASILTPYIKCHKVGKNYVINGSKKPCSLAHSMDLITFSLALPSADGEKLAVAIIPANTKGIEIKKFWNSTILAGAETEEVVFRDVEVNEKLLSYTGSAKDMDDIQVSGFIWFELLLTASYVGAACRGLKKLINSSRSHDTQLVSCAKKIECSMNSIFHLSSVFDKSEGNHRDILARILLTRYSVQDLINEVASESVEALGGMQFIQDQENQYILSVTKALAFHPPSKSSMNKNIADWLKGEQLAVC